MPRRKEKPEQFKHCPTCGDTIPDRLTVCDDCIARCPGCGFVTKDGIPPDVSGPWWCRDCLQARCSEAWRATQTYKRRQEATCST